MSGGRRQGPDDTNGNIVHLALPLGPACAALARTTAVAAGRLAGLGRATLGSLALAVDEALVLLLPTTAEGLDLDLVIGDGALGVTITTRQPQGSPDAEATTRFETLVEELVTSVTIDNATGVVRLEVRDPPTPSR